MKKKMIALSLVAVLCLTACAAVFVGCDNEQPRAYVSLDINPSVSLVLAADGTVESAVAENDDARVLLVDVSLEGKTLQEAARIVAEASVECGFLSEDNSVVDVTVVAEDGSVEYEGSLLGELQQAFTAAVGEDSFDVTFNSEGSYTLNRMLEYYKEKYPNNADVQAMTPAKLDIVLSVTQKDGSISFESAAALDISSLITMAETTYAQIEPYMNAVYEAAVAEAELVYENAKAVAASAVWAAKYTEFMLDDVTVDWDDVMGGDFSDIIGGAETLLTENYGLQYAVYDSLAITLDYLLDKCVQLQGYANAALEKVDTARLADLLGVEEAELKAAIADESGNITLEAIDAYVDRLVKNAAADVKEQYESSDLKAYLNGLQASAEEQVEKLPEEYADAIYAAADALEYTGVKIGEFFTDLSELTIEDMRGAVTKLEAKRDAAMAEIEANLTDEQMAEIEAALADMDETIASAEAKLAEVKAEAKAAVESALKQLKEELVSEHKVTVTVQ